MLRFVLLVAICVLLFVVRCDAFVVCRVICLFLFAFVFCGVRFACRLVFVALLFVACSSLCDVRCWLLNCRLSSCLVWCVLRVVCCVVCCVLRVV